MDERLNIMRQFEKDIKRIIFDKYGIFLTVEKMTNLNETILVNEKLLAEMNTVEEMQGTVIRKSFDLVIDMKTTKDVVLEDGSVVSIPYGEVIENGIIEYYTKKLADEYQIHINETPELQRDLTFITLLQRKLQGGLDPRAFSEDAIKLLNAEELGSFVKKYDSYEIEQYLNRAKTLASDDKTKEEENNLVKENVERENSIQIVWIKERKNIKYIDETGEVHLIDIEDSKNAQEFYEKSFANLAPDKKKNPEEFYHELLKIIEEEKLTKTDDVKKEDLNYEEMDMFAFIESNDKIKKEEQKDVVTHSTDQEVHVTQSNKSVVVTEDKAGYVEAHEIKDGQPLASKESLQESTDISSRLLTRSEYEDLLMKSYNGENLSKSQLEQLRRACIYYSQIDKQAENTMPKEEEGPKLLPKNNNSSSGFTNKMLPLYLSTILVLAITILIVYLLSK